MSDKFEYAKQQHSDMADLLDRMQSYVHRQYGAGEPYIIPSLAGAAISLTDGEAYVLLEILASAGVVERAFNVYCRATDRYLTTAKSIEELDDPRLFDGFCDECGHQHDASEMRVELAFTVAKENRLSEAA